MIDNKKRFLKVDWSFINKYFSFTNFYEPLKIKLEKEVEKNK